MYCVYSYLICNYNDVLHDEDHVCYYFILKSFLNVINFVGLLLLLPAITYLKFSYRVQINKSKVVSFCLYKKMQGSVVSEMVNSSHRQNTMITPNCNLPLFVISLYLK